MSRVRIRWPAWLALIAVVTRDPFVLGVTLLVLMAVTRVSRRGVLAALGSSVILYLAAGFAPALRFLLIFLVTALASQHVSLRDVPEWWKPLGAAIQETRTRLDGLGWRERIIELRRMVPPSPTRAMRTPAELAVWAILLLPLAGATWTSTSSRDGFVVTHPGGRFEVTRPGEIHIAGPAGGLTVDYDGTHARVLEAGCREKRCMRQGRTADGVIICVPNRVVIRPRGARGGAVDAWTG